MAAATPLMQHSDFLMLKKLLALTASDQDGEALTAARKANALLLRTNVHWFDLVDAAEHSRPAPQAQPEPPPAQPERTAYQREIDDALELVLTTASGDFRRFILGLKEQWEETGTLSPRQRDALLKAKRKNTGEEPW